MKKMTMAGLLEATRGEYEEWHKDPNGKYMDSFDTFRENPHKAEAAKKVLKNRDVVRLVRKLKNFYPNEIEMLSDPERFLGPQVSWGDILHAYVNIMHKRDTNLAPASRDKEERAEKVKFELRSSGIPETEENLGMMGQPRKIRRDRARGERQK